MYRTNLNEMIRTIGEEYRLTRSMTGRGALPPRIRDAFLKVPRQEFVEPRDRDRAFENHPLPIGEGQTISQPFIVALMTDLLEPAPQQRVLEIGTGSGYQAAILSLLVGEVFSVERIPSLARQAEERLSRLGYANVRVRQGDGHQGWAQEAPFDGILVTCAATQVPPALLAQLACGGRMLIPVGPPYSFQQLRLLEKDSQGAVRSTNVLGVAFVPLVGGETEASGVRSEA